MSRTDTRLGPPPVRIGAAQARAQAATLRTGAEQTAGGAGGWGQREPSNGSMTPRLRIDRGAGPNSAIGIDGTIPIGNTRRKAGYPPIQVP